MRNASFDMPEFRNPDGTVWVWDAESSSYVQKPSAGLEQDRGHATGGDNDLFNQDQIEHSELAGVPELEGHMASLGGDYEEWGEPPSSVPKFQPGEHVSFRGGGGGTILEEAEEFEGGYWYRVKTDAGITVQAPEEAMLRPEGYDQPGDVTLQDLGIPPEGEDYYRDRTSARTVNCPLCQEPTNQRACPICHKDLTPEWNQDEDDVLEHPMQRTIHNDGMPDRVPKRNRMKTDDSYPSMALSFTIAQKLASRQVVAEDDWDNFFQNGGSKVEIGKWLLDRRGQFHFDHGMHSLHEQIAARDGIQYPADVAALGSVYNDGTADTQRVFAQPFNQQQVQTLITQAFGPVTLQGPMQQGQQKGVVFEPFEITGGQWIISPQKSMYPIRGEAWVKEQAQGPYQPQMILVAEHVQPEDYQLWVNGCAGIVTATGGMTSHAAYLAATEEIPVIVGIGDAYSKIETGNYLKIDPARHVITVLPSHRGLSQDQNRDLYNNVLQYQRNLEQRNPDLIPKPVTFAHVDEEMAWRTANERSLDSCPSCNDVMMDQGSESSCHSCGHTQPIITTQAAVLAPLGEAAMGGLAGGGEAAAAGGGGGIAGIGGLMNKALGGGAFQMGKDIIPGGGASSSPSPGASMPDSGAEMQGTVASTFGEEEVGNATKNRGENSDPDQQSSSGDSQKEHGDSPEQLKDIDGPGDAKSDAFPEDDLKNQGDPALQDKAMKAFHMNMPLVIEFANSDEPGSENPILLALDELLEEAFPGYKDGTNPINEETEHPADEVKSEDESGEKPEEGDSKEDKKPDPKEASVWHFAMNPYDEYPTRDDVHGPIGEGEYICANCETPTHDYGTGRCPHCGEKLVDNEPDPFTDHLRELDNEQAPGHYEMHGPDQPRMEDFVSSEKKAFGEVPMAPDMGAPGVPGAPSCPYCGQSHAPGTPCPTADQAMMAPATAPTTAPGTMGAPIGPPQPNKVITKSTGSNWQVIAIGQSPLQEPEGGEFVPGGQDVGISCPNCGSPNTVHKQGLMGCRNCFYTFNPEQGVGQQVPDTIPWGDAEQDYYRQASLEEFSFYAAVDTDNNQNTTTAEEPHHLHHHHKHDEGGNDWVDESGAPLQEGQTYELKSSNYAIPDRVTIDRILPDKLVYSTNSGDISYRNEMTKEELATEGYSFIPAGPDSAQVDSADGFQDYEAPVRPGQDATPQVDDLSTPSTVVSHEFAPVSLENYTGSFKGDSPDARAWLNDGSGVDVDPQLMAKIAGKDYSPREQREFIDESGSARNLDRLDLEGTHYIADDLGLGDSLW